MTKRRLPSSGPAPTAAPVKVVRLAHGEGLALPAYQTAQSAGLDLLAACPDDAPMTLSPGARALVPTGLCLELTAGYEGQVRPRSGLALRHGVTVLNSPGTIDADYRGEVQVLLVNLGAEPFLIRRGERIAQLVVARFEQVRLEETTTLTGTARGAGGFGSTGRSAPSARPAKPAPAAKSPPRARPARRRSGAGT